MEDREIYEIIMGDEVLQGYLNEDNYVRLYRYLKERDSTIKFGELTAFLKNADIDISISGIVPTEAFKGDKSLTEFNFSKITSIEPSAFEGSGIRKVVLKNNQKVGQMAFKDSDVEEIYLSDGVDIGPAAFSRCNNLKELYISGGVVLSPLVFASCRNLEEVVFDEGRDNWPSDLFANVKHINYVTMPEVYNFTIFDRDIAIDTLYIIGSRESGIELSNIQRSYPNIHELEFLK